LAVMPATHDRSIDVRYATLEDCHEATGLVVVVDVIRAFTTAAHVLDRGAAEIWPVAGVDEALALRRANPDVLVIGEEGGIKVDGFDAGNSPSELDSVDFAGRIVVQRTSAGTQAIARSSGADHLLAASFVCAGATVRAIRALAEGPVTFVVTGVDARRDGDEDRACAEYLAALVQGTRPDPAPYLARVPASTAGREFLDAEGPHRPVADLDLAMELDRFTVALQVDRGERDVLRVRRE